MDRITAELIQNSLVYASEEMGIALRNAAYSPNIKERMDHSAALFDEQGRLLAQAEHIPVHLGSLPWGLRNILQHCESEGLKLEEGSMVVANNPYIAGTHLNDVTVVSPIYYSGQLIGFAANKAHHSDMGGRVPGSISIDARSLFEEGTIINPMYLMRRGEFVRETLSFFSSNSRAPHERLGDLRAQAAANITGARRLLELISRYGLEAFREACELSFEYSRTMTERRLSRMADGPYRAVDYLEAPDGEDIRLEVLVRISGGRMGVDFTGTQRQVDYPLNAVYGVTLSAVYFVVRTLTGDDFPANYGAFEPIEVHAPEGTVLNPTFPHPVAGGNVETSQRVADVLFLALSRALPERVPAAAGGSMNNVMIGGFHRGRTWAFYETIGVGMGGRRGIDGIDGVQCNMTNTMNTPIEEIERLFPLLVTRYEFRPNSSGAGEYRGGSGLIRAYRALSDSITFTILADRERHAPWGLHGGRAGARTRVFLVRQGKTRRIPSKATVVLRKGDEVQVHTAGGGGYGRPSARARAKVEEDLMNGIVTEEYVAKHYGFRPAPRIRRA
jgi:N-methylhydantoinase B